MYADVPTLIQDFVDKGTRLNSEQEKDLREAINALKVRGASINEANSTTTAVTTATYGAELHNTVVAE